MGGGITEGEADARYVNLAGDTMTGQLTMTAPLVLPGGVPTGQQAIYRAYLDLRIGTGNADIAALGTRLTTAEGRIADHETRIVALENATRGLGGRRPR